MTTDVLFAAGMLLASGDMEFTVGSGGNIRFNMASVNAVTIGVNGADGIIAGGAAGSHLVIRTDGSDTIDMVGGSASLKNIPSAPTASPGTNTTQIATTAFVTAAVGGGVVSAPFFVRQFYPTF